MITSKNNYSKYKKVKKKEFKHITTKCHQLAKSDSKRGAKGLQNGENNRMSMANSYLSIFTVNENRLNLSIKRVAK